jgi:hypothetical protein
MRTKIMLMLVFVQLAGCSTVVTQLKQDRRDAPWDPKGSATLMDQIPNEDGAAGKRCCGHLRTCQAHQTPRC